VIDLDESAVVHTIWFLPLGGAGDLLVTLARRGDGPWRLEVRQRIYRDSHVFDSTDDKSWMTFEARGEEDYKRSHVAVEMLARQAEEIIGLAVGRGAGPLYTVPVHGSGLDAMEALSRQPWCHIKTLGKAGSA